MKASEQSNHTTADFHVVSFGGVGSKLVVKGLCPGQSPKILNSRHHHWRQPPRSLDWQTRVIFLFGDPRDSVISFFNRRNTMHAGHGFQGKDRAGKPDWPQRHCRNLEGDWQELSTEWDLAAFLAHGRDLFRLQEHFDNWLTSARPKRVLFVRFEELWSNLPEVLAFLDLPAQRAATFPPRQGRGSDWRRQSDELRVGLDTLYGNLARRLETLPDVFGRDDVAK